MKKLEVVKMLVRMREWTNECCDGLDMRKEWKRRDWKRTFMTPILNESGEKKEHEKARWMKFLKCQLEKALSFMKHI